MTTSIMILTPPRHVDERGWFSETYNAARFGAAGLGATFVQDNQSLSRQAGTIRGLHFQAPPFAQAKLVRVLRGRILDVAVDIRRGSPTYGRWVSAELSAENGRQMLVPAGYAHGFVTLAADTEVLYKVTARYDKASEGGLRWDDPALAIDWGLGASPPLVSAKDDILPHLSGFVSPFEDDGVPMRVVEAAL